MVACTVSQEVSLHSAPLTHVAKTQDRVPSLEELQVLPHAPSVLKRPPYA